MSGKRWLVVGVIAISLVIALIFLQGSLTSYRGEKPQFRLVPPERPAAEPEGVPGTEVGAGWSRRQEADQALEEAAAMALKGKPATPPDFAIIFASSGSDLPGILAAARKLWGEKTKIFGGTSDSRAVLTNKGFIKAAAKAFEPQLHERALALMTVTSRDIGFGVGAADFGAYATVREASQAALRRALKSAGRPPQDKPQAVLTTISHGDEDEALAGIEAEMGKSAPVLGGTASGPRFGILGENNVVPRGISLAVIYTRLPVGLAFEGGFDKMDTPGGVVTKVEGRAIVEINGKPALDLYDEWLGGQVRKLIEEVGDERKIRDFMVLHPFYRRYRSATGQDYLLFSHPWPKDKTLQEKSIMTSTNIQEGDEIYLSHGTWSRLLNRIGNLPVTAKVQGNIGLGRKSILGIGFICAGVMGIIPEEERPKMAYLINYHHNHAPFIANFTWGEQGHLPGVGNKHGNLLTSFLIISAGE